MLYVKFYTSFFMLHNIRCGNVQKMFMLPLHIYLLCDIINTHLFESFKKQKDSKPIKNDLICEIGRFFIYLTKWSTIERRGCYGASEEPFPCMAKPHQALSHFHGAPSPRLRQHSDNAKAQSYSPLSPLYPLDIVD
ncbi:MAG: hypothetical protein JWO54_54 [Candidatus Saccharibacteria bacterium]|nr:hypothetical protein [Candidatus Saccharibacteria bacterium]